MSCIPDVLVLIWEDLSWLEHMWANRTGCRNLYLVNMKHPSFLLRKRYHWTTSLVTQSWANDVVTAASSTSYYLTETARTVALVWRNSSLPSIVTDINTGRRANRRETARTVALVSKSPQACMLFNYLSSSRASTLRFVRVKKKARLELSDSSS
jgi:hypothetical protein